MRRYPLPSLGRMTAIRYALLFRTYANFYARARPAVRRSRLSWHGKIVGTPMCKCTPTMRTPFCGKPGCEWPTQGITHIPPLRRNGLPVFRSGYSDGRLPSVRVFGGGGGGSCGDTVSYGAPGGLGGGGAGGGRGGGPSAAFYHERSD